MSIRYSAKVSLQNTKSELKPIRIRVSFSSQRIDISTGYSWESDKWDSATGLPKKRTKNANNQNYVDVTIAINNMLEKIDKYFSKCDIDNIEPSADQIKLLFSDRRNNDGILVKSFIAEYITQQQKKQLSENSLNNIMSMCNIFCNKAFPDIQVSQLHANILVDFSDFLSDEQQVCNATASNYIQKVTGFLNYVCDKCGIDIEFNKVSLKEVKEDTKSYLTPDELKKVYGFSSHNKKMQLVRDLFIFCCFTGLRYSDMQKLSKSEVSDVDIYTTCGKTGKKVRIELNKYSREILDKYASNKGPKVFPKISLIYYNTTLRNILIRLSIDTPTIKEYYQGEKLITEEVPKYEIIASHSARRTFVVQSLLKGVPPMVVIRWTGHKDLQSLAPYIAIADTQRKNEMQKLDADL